MPQLSLYLDDATMDTLRQQSKVKQVSLSRVAAEAIRGQHCSAWPINYFDLYGCLNDPSFVAPDDPPFGVQGGYDDFAWRD